MKKRLFPKIVFCLVFVFSIVLPMHNSSAHERGGVVGNSYLTFLFAVAVRPHGSQYCIAD